MSYKTDQETFWAGGFGDHYIDRNQDASMAASNIALFSQVLALTRDVGSVIEFGANIGLSLLALRRLLPDAALSAVEINHRAVEQLRRIEGLEVTAGSILAFTPNRQHDLVFTKCLLIHINPAQLPTAYDVIHASARRYICVTEYYNPSPVDVVYRGHESKLFKRDFAGELLDRFPDLKLIDYAFVYHRDVNFPQDDLTWFLLEKSS